MNDEKWTNTFADPVSEVSQMFLRHEVPAELLLPVYEAFEQLAHWVARGPRNRHATIALHKLLEAKDAAIRARVADYIASRDATKLASPEPSKI